MPKAGKGKSSKAHFLTEHVSMYGLKIMERCPSTSEIVSVQCQFCVYYGPETDPEKPHQRAKKTTKMAWTKCFRADRYQDHHKSEHSSIWTTYQASTYDEKLRFFDSKIPVQNTMVPHVNFGSTATALKINIHPSIVDILISDMFFHPDDQGRVTQQAALKLFSRKGDYYEVTISNPLQFDLIVSHIARGISFRQCEGIIADTRDIAGICTST